MATASIQYSGNLRTECTHNESGSKIITDAPKDNNGNGEAFSPTDLVAAALGSCMMTIIGIRANKSDWEISEMSADIKKVMVSDPRRIKEIHVDIRIKDNGFSNSTKEIIKRAAETCPVAMSLSPDLKLILQIEYY